MNIMRKKKIYEIFMKKRLQKLVLIIHLQIYYRKKNSKLYFQE